MIGLVLVTHGRLAEEFVHALEHIVGRQEGIETVCIGPTDRMEARRADITAAVTRADQGQGVIILTDMFGGTPSNLAISRRFFAVPGRRSIAAAGASRTASAKGTDLQ